MNDGNSLLVAYHIKPLATIDVTIRLLGGTEPPETKKSIRVIYKVTEDDREELTYKVLEFGKKPPLAQNEAW